MSSEIDRQKPVDDCEVDAAGLREVLLGEIGELPTEQAELLARFISQLGGVEEALEALEQLRDLRKAG